MNRSEYTRALIQYVVGYMCKNEKSPIDAVNMLKHIVNSTISDSTSFSSIAHRFNQKLLSSRIILASEADFLLTRLSSYESSFTFQNASLNVGTRVVTFTEEDDDHLNQPSLRQNPWDKFISFKNSDTPQVEDMWFYKFVCSIGYGNNVVPVFSYANLTPTWPLNEEFCKSILLLYRKNIKCYEDIVGPYSKYSEALMI